MKQSSSPFQWILDEYSETISMEQMRIVCHISKRTARHLLENGLIPCEISPKKTRRFTIKTTEVVYYLKRRELYPNDYLPPENWYGCKVDGKTRSRKRYLSKPMQLKMKAFAPQFLKQYEDVLNLQEIIDITGYSKTFIKKWCDTQTLYHFYMGSLLYVPTVSLLDFILADDFGGILPSSVMWKAFNASKQSTPTISNP